MREQNGFRSPPREGGAPPPGGAGTAPADSTAAGNDGPATAAGGDGLDAAEDWLLSVRAGEGDDDAFAVLVRRHTPALLALAIHLLGNLADAEDAVQDAFIRAWRRLPEFRGDAQFRTWMYRIVTNRCLNTLRRRTPTVSLENAPEPTTRDAHASPERAAETDAAAAALARALGTLPVDQRACWVLRELHGLHYEEIAQVMGTSEQSVRGRLFRARRSLTKEMTSWR
ncbi:sigma-70 family RNA polymerase sigma factor [Streptomyces sp. NPDC051776]|uniref:RNA polymerase sigma factor n=1 Tax=Streptomyces sp. NPDC051776 TaxID=3155414 RepID=UPI00344044A4